MNATTNATPRASPKPPIVASDLASPARARPPVSLMPDEPTAAVATQSRVPALRRRRRIAGVIFPVAVAGCGLASAFLLYTASGSLPIGIVCSAVGLVGARFCHVLMRERLVLG